MRFAGILRHLIEDSKMSQKQLANEIQVSPFTLANYVQGSRSPGYDTLMSIAGYFNVTTDYLLSFQLENADDRQESMLRNWTNILHPAIYYPISFHFDSVVC